MKENDILLGFSDDEQQGYCVNNFERSRVMAKYNYPGPCSPNYKEPTSVEECLPQARRLVRKLARGETRPEIVGAIEDVAPHFSVSREGDNFLIVTVPDQNKYVAEAVTQALMEQGAKKVDFIYPLDLVGKNPDKCSVEDGWREVELYKEDKASGTKVDLLTGQGLAEATAKYLDTHPEYTCVCLDVAGGNVLMGLGKHASKFNSFWPLNNWEWFFCKGHIFPAEVWKEFERMIVELLGEASEVRITDPEGTYLEFSLTAEEAARCVSRKPVHGHLSMNPLMATGGMARQVLEGYLPPLPVFPRLNGVLASTANHCGYFPRMETYFEDDRLVEVKGGGKYGDGIRELMDRYKDIQWPGYPDKGLFWFCDTALCTAVGVHRRKSDMFNSYWVYPNLPERTRAGVFHLGFGTRIPARVQKAFLEYGEEHGLHQGHIHGGHLYFATYEIKIRGTDYWHKIVDKGWITALSDPVIRAMAAKYAEPDELLKYDWIPPLPGINCEGDYLKDYAPNPAAYLKKRIKEGKTI